MRTTDGGKFSVHNAEWVQHFLDLAKLVSTRSKDPSTKCGAVIIDDHRRIVSTGYNGFPRQMPDAPEAYEDRDAKYPRIIHADMNALLFAKRDLEGCCIYTWPLLPCDRCFVHLAQAGITDYIAPALTDPSQIDRWGPSIARTKLYATEMGLHIWEVDLEHWR